MEAFLVSCLQLDAAIYGDNPAPDYHVRSLRKQAIAQACALVKPVLKEPPGRTADVLGGRLPITGQPIGIRLDIDNVILDFLLQTIGDETYRARLEELIHEERQDKDDVDDRDRVLAELLQRFEMLQDASSIDHVRELIYHVPFAALVLALVDTYNYWKSTGSEHGLADRFLSLLPVPEEALFPGHSDPGTRDVDEDSWEEHIRRRRRGDAGQVPSLQRVNDEDDGRTVFPQNYALPSPPVERKDRPIVATRPMTPLRALPAARVSIRVWDRTIRPLLMNIMLGGIVVSVFAYILTRHDLDTRDAVITMGAMGAGVVAALFVAMYQHAPMEREAEDTSVSVLRRLCTRAVGTYRRALSGRDLTPRLQDAAAVSLAYAVSPRATRLLAPVRLGRMAIQLTDWALHRDKKRPMRTLVYLASTGARSIIYTAIAYTVLTMETHQADMLAALGHMMQEAHDIGSEAMKHWHDFQ